jgi:hypothetical protein
MNNSTIRIEKGEVYKISTPANIGSVSNTAQVWLTGSKIQDRLIASLSANSNVTVGPFLNIVNYRIEFNASGTIEKVGVDDSDPISPFDYKAVAEAVDDATDADDIVDQFNALLASLRAAGYLAAS